jgi:hypothetical protein
MYVLTFLYLLRYVLTSLFLLLELIVFGQVLGTPTSKKIKYEYRAPTIEESPVPDSPNTVRAQAAISKKTITLHIKELEFEVIITRESLVIIFQSELL